MAMIIKQDTVWLAGSVHTIKDVLQIAYGATLTIEPGAVVKGGTIQAFGTLDIEGTAVAPIILESVQLTFGDDYKTPGRLEIHHATITGGAFLPANGGGSYGSFSLTDSVISNAANYSYILYPTSASIISRNIFMNTLDLDVGTNASASLVISDNLFYNVQSRFHSAAIVGLVAYGDPVLVTRNSFIGVDYALEVVNDGRIYAPDNYFGTIDPAEIRKAILDQKDDLSRPSVIRHDPDASEPSSNIPARIGTADDDSLVARGKLYQFGLAGDDHLTGSVRTDHLFGGDGDDVIKGGKGADHLAGGAGSDVYLVDNVDDVVSESSELNASDVDTVISQVDYSLGTEVENLTLTNRAHVGAGNELDNRISGGGGADALSGLGGNDKLIGGDGGDRLDGGAGDDVLDGGLRTDMLTGGGGADVFRFAIGDTSSGLKTADVITDFRHSDGDKINLSAIDAISGTPGLEAFTFIGGDAFSGVAGELRARVSGQDTIVMGDTNGDGSADLAIRVAGNIALANGDFILGTGGAATSDSQINYTVSEHVPLWVTCTYMPMVHMV